MAVTLLLSVVLMAGLFLMLYAAVYFIQERRFFTSAPKEILEVLPDHWEERFPGAHALGWFLGIVSIVMIAGALWAAGWEGIQRGFTMKDFFLRYLIMLELLEVFDILFIDWFLLCRSNFFTHLYPEAKPLTGPHLFGFNWKSHVVLALVAIPLAWVLARTCVLF